MKDWKLLLAAALLSIASGSAVSVMVNARLFDLAYANFNPYSSIDGKVNQMIFEYENLDVRVTELERNGNQPE